jgi:DNA-binding MarR family transcriptional regulator
MKRRKLYAADAVERSTGAAFITAVVISVLLLPRVAPAKHGRAYSFQITESGTKELHAARQARMMRIEELLEYWSEEERSLFGQLLTKFNRTYK